MDFSKLTPEQFKIAELVVEAAEANNIDPNLLLAQAFQESGFRHIPNKKSDAFGVMQIRPGTAEQNKLGDITDLRANIFGGASLMKKYLDKYKTPEAALLAYHQGPGVASKYVESGGDLTLVGPKGLDYVIKIGEYGGLGAPLDAGDEENKSPFANYESEAAKLRREQGEEPPAKAAPEEKPESSITPEMGAMAGAAANLLGPAGATLEIAPRIDTGKAQERAAKTADALELARQNLARAVPQGTQSLEASFNQSKQAIERLKNEQRLAESRLKGLPKAIPAAPAQTPEPTIAPEAVSRTRPGDAGAVNWVHSMAEGVPEVVAGRALNMRADNPLGGQAIIDAEMAARQRQAALGLENYGLARTEGGVQLALPPTTVAERQAAEARQAEERRAELARNAEQARLQQAAQAQMLEQQRLAHEADLERVRQARSQLGQQHNVLAGQVKTMAPMQRAMTKAEADAEIARRSLSRAKEQPSMLARPLDVAGVKSAKLGPITRTGLGGLAGYAGVMSYQEALERFKAGDTSEGVLKALEAGSFAAAVAPPIGKTMTRVRGAGVLGGLGLGGYELGKRLLKERPPTE